MQRCAWLFLATAAIFACSHMPAWGEEPPEATKAGHSYHGEIFNEGPRQQAYLMGGTGRVHFPVTTHHNDVQPLIDQGIGQLHGFWFFEAERTFRQAAALDPDCAMAYWGAAQANEGNETRAKGFMKEALAHKDGVTPRELLYLEAFDHFLNDSGEKKERAAAYAEALLKISQEFPADVEAKAFLALQYYLNKSDGIEIKDYEKVDALLSEIFQAEPLHPAHHFRIHLWDNKDQKRALDAAAKCGPAAPQIAHMWHMPGHTYSGLKRYADAAWQQEASARVDHAHMMHDGILPDQIHNFAHNNEWLIRDLIYVGRMRDAIDLAKNMTELPRHPSYNTLDKRGSAYYGRLRLFETLVEFECWEELIALADTPYLEPTDKPAEQVKRLRWLGAACFEMGEFERGEQALADLEGRLRDERAKQQTAGDEAEQKAKTDVAAELAQTVALDEPPEPASREAFEQQVKDRAGRIRKARDEARRKFDGDVRAIEQGLAELRGRKAAYDGEYTEAVKQLERAKANKLQTARYRLLAGDAEKAIRDLKKQVSSRKNEILPLAYLADAYWQTDDQDKAKEMLEKIRDLSAAVDLDAAPLARLDLIASAAGCSADWRKPAMSADDLGERPELDSLGPFRWSPSAAPEWSLQNASDETVSLKQYARRPLVLIFYLGHGCLHCVEQIHAFAAAAPEFEKAGIALAAISSEDMEQLKRSVNDYQPGIPFPLLAGDKLDTFRAYRAYDDFESQPLHATLLIDGQGRIRWQDISYEPFKDHKFLLEEAQRLLKQ